MTILINYILIFSHVDEVNQEYWIQDMCHELCPVTLDWLTFLPDRRSSRTMWFQVLPSST
jgi:hypothetical protein